MIIGVRVKRVWSGAWFGVTSVAYSNMVVLGRGLRPTQRGADNQKVGGRRSREKVDYGRRVGEDNQKGTVGCVSLMTTTTTAVLERDR